MNAAELRMGNLVKRNGIVVTSQQMTAANCHKFPSQYEPIPLTEDWLVRFGATIWKETPRYKLFKIKKLLFGKLKCKGCKGFDLVFDGGSINKSPILYVHTLQNVCFDLDEELKEV